MDEYQSLSHTVWDCKYHVVWIPKCRRKALFEELRKHLGQVFRSLALQKESKVLEGHIMYASGKPSIIVLVSCMKASPCSTRGGKKAIVC